MAEGDRPRLASLDRRSSWLTVSKALEMSRNTAPTYFWCQGPYTICQGSGGEEFGLSGKGGIQTEEGRAGCGCGDVVKAGCEHASRELRWKRGEERWDGSSWVRYSLHLCEGA